MYWNESMREVKNVQFGILSPDEIVSDIVRFFATTK